MIGDSTCAPTETRTPVLALRGPRPGPLDDGGMARRAERSPEGAQTKRAGEIVSSRILLVNEKHMHFARSMHTDGLRHFDITCA